MTKEQAIADVERAKVTPLNDWASRLRTNFIFLQDRPPTSWMPLAQQRYTAFYQYLVRAGVSKADAKRIATEDEAIEAVSVPAEETVSKPLLKDLPKVNQKPLLKDIPKIARGVFDGLPRGVLVGGAVAGAVVIGGLLFRKVR